MLLIYQRCIQISLICEDIFDKPFEELYDIVLCTLTLHHFKDEEIIKIMTSFYANASIGVVVNDLQRSTLFIDCFSVCVSFSIKQYVKARWLISILRGFKKKSCFVFLKN
jgi:hypothetical protein